MTDSASPADESLREALFIALMCRCDNCGETQLLDDIDNLLAEDTDMWAKAAACRVQPLGWSSPFSQDSNSGVLLCPECGVSGTKSANIQE